MKETTLILITDSRVLAQIIDTLCLIDARVEPAQLPKLPTITTRVQYVQPTYDQIQQMHAIEVQEG